MMPSVYNQSTPITFDDHVLTDYFLLSDLSLPLPSFAPTTRDVAGMDGVLFADNRMQQLEISMTISVWDLPIDDRRELIGMLWGWLQVDEPKPLQIGDAPYWLVVPAQCGELEHYINADAVSLRFLACDPVRYGEEKTATIPSGGSVQIEVEGTYPAYLTIEADAAVRGPSNLWGVRVDSGDYSRVSLPTASATAVTIDAASRTASISGDPAMITLTSDWLRVDPGEHTLAMDVGTGAATVTWVERWL